jgi:hypothetical protein
MRQKANLKYIIPFHPRIHLRRTPLQCRQSPHRWSDAYRSALLAALYARFSSLTRPRSQD